MKKTLLALALVASTYGAFAAKPANKKAATEITAAKPKKHKKTAAKAVVATKPVVVAPKAAVVTPAPAPVAKSKPAKKS